jgi:hypothetical protein
VIEEMQKELQFLDFKTKVHGEIDEAKKNE